MNRHPASQRPSPQTQALRLEACPLNLNSGRRKS